MQRHVANEAERRFGIRILTFSQWRPDEGQHPGSALHIFSVEVDFREQSLSDDEFLAVSEWLEQRGFLATRQFLQHDSGTEHVCTVPAERHAATVGFHATRTVSVPTILRQGLQRGDRTKSTSRMDERIDQLGNIYVAEHLGQPGDEASGIKGTAHWWREHKAKVNCFADPDWSILRLDFAGLPDLRLYRDPWSRSGFILRTEIPGCRIEQVA
jgi:hypothetical protein